MAKKDNTVIIKKGTGKNALTFSVSAEMLNKNEKAYIKDGYSIHLPEIEEKEVKEPKAKKETVVPEVLPLTNTEIKHEDGQ